MHSPDDACFGLDELSWIDVAAHVAGDPRLIIPVGALEQHGPHLPLGANVLLARKVAVDLSIEFRVLRAPTMHYGVNVAGDRAYAGTAWLQQKTLHRAVNELLATWEAHGFAEFILVTAHRHEPHLDALATLVTDRARVRVVSIWDVPIGDLLEAQPGPLHGCEAETSVMLHLYPELVHMERARDFELPADEFDRYIADRLPALPPGGAGVVGRPTLATAARPAAPAAPAARGDEPLGRPSKAPVVVIDPGHGGIDPGRIGPGGLKEKDVVLQVSKRLAEVLLERGYEVRMTRTTDTLINLDDRSHMANEWRGSRPGLFLSIHANGVSDRRVQGFETFFLSDARTEDERRVAEMENAAMAYETHDRVVGTDELSLILNNLRNDYYIRASHGLAGLVQDAFGQFHTGANRGVKQAGFRVLIGAFMPAVLIELGFISNPQEERMLGSGRFQVQAAHAIADAVDRFFHKERELWGGASP
jgi:N-acetylmuramoyl-L-alanine amidase